MLHVVQVADVVVGIFHAGNGALCDIVVCFFQRQGHIVVIFHKYVIPSYCALRQR